MRRILTRGLGVLTMGQGVLLLVLGVLPLLLLDAADSAVGWVGDSAWPTLSVLAFVLSAVMPFILIAFYVYQIEEAGALGLVGVVIAIIGLLLHSSLQFDMAFVWPVLAVRDPELLDFSGPLFRAGGFAFVHTWMTWVYAVGILVFGIAIFRARVFPRAISVLFTVGMFLSAGQLLPPLVIRTAGALLASPALVWMGLTLWSRWQRVPAAT